MEVQTQILSVSAYAALIQRAAKGVGSAVVEGEVQKPRTTGGGALMFDLTDGDSRFVCKVLPWVAKRLEYKPSAGELVRVEVAYPDFWPQGGSISVVVEKVELAGDGELLRRRVELITRLQAEGLTDPAGFPPLPRFPGKVGVIAGADSDALKDVLRCLGERFPQAVVITACCPVQGAAAPRAMVSALARLETDPAVDVIILARGGGSVRDLAAFDDESLCRAISALGTPVITAIGHTDNDPVCNRVTHAAYVPRHAAELVVPDRLDLLRDADDARQALARGTAAFADLRIALDARQAALRGVDRVRGLRARVADSSRVLDQASNRFVNAHRDVVRDFTRASERVLEGQRSNWLRAFDRHAASMELAGRRQLRDAGRLVDRLAAIMDAGDFRRRGWLLASGEDGRAIRSAAGVRAGERLHLHLSDGRIEAVVDTTETATEEP